MAQIAWKVRTNRGRTFEIGLFHGDKEGHVMLYSNSKVVQIDFNVQETKVYKMMLDQELCEVIITRQLDGSYQYECKLDKESSTPLNDWRKAQQESVDNHEQQRLIFGAGVFLVIVVLGWFLLG